jgi:membrane protease YdiL (CAAX protease family)
LNASAAPFGNKAVVAIVLLYAASGLILLLGIGPWEAVRRVAVEGMILLAWLWAAHRILRGVPVPEPEPIKYPVPEVLWLLGTLIVAVGLAAAYYGGWLDTPSWLLPLVILGAVLALFVVLRYPVSALGLAWPPKRGWLALLAVIAVNFAAAAIFQILPGGEAEPVPQADLANQITGIWSVLVLIIGLLVRAALPEEILLRVALQPRLAQLIPVGWAMLVQALLFSAIHLPQRLIGYQEPWSMVLGYTLTVNNGLIAGYLWWRTRSLPLVLLLHLFAYPRFGV